MQKDSLRKKVTTKNMFIVLDASVITKWFYEEEGNKQARKILTTIIEEKKALVAPKILYFELGNVFLNKKHFNAKQFQTVIQVFNLINLSLIDFTYNDWPIITILASKYQSSFYDACYYYLAEKLACEFITADNKLYQKLNHNKRVRILR